MKQLRWVSQLLSVPETEPRGLLRLYLGGVLITVFGGLIVVSVGVYQGLWKFEENDPSFEAWGICRLQNHNRLTRIEEIEARRSTSQNRLDELNKALTEPTNPAFVEARTAIEAERIVYQDILREREAARIQTLTSFLPQFILGLLLAVLFSLIAARLASRQGSKAVVEWREKAKHVNWRLTYSLWVGIIFITHTAREVYTSILSEDKSWFGWSSFCVSSEAWSLMHLPSLGVAMVVAYPATILWNFGSRRILPPDLSLGDKDGQWGVGRYVLFLQTWSFLSLVFLLLPGGLWLRALLHEPRFTSIYLLPSALLSASVLIIVGRMIRNAIAIRKMYQVELRGLGDTWQQIQEKKPPPDPTTTFLGEHWWKLPAVISGIFALSWLVVEQIGVSDLILRLAGLK